MNKKYILILILGILFTSCEKDEIGLLNSSQELESQTNLNSLDFFKKWHQNQNKSSENSFYNFTKPIEWKNAKSFSLDSLDIAIIPLQFDKNFSLQKSDKILKNLSLVMFNNEGQYTSSYIIASEKKIQLEKENVLNEIFDNDNNYIIQHSKISNYKNSLNSSKNKNLYKYVSKRCYEIVEVFTDGSIRDTGITYCETSDSGGNGVGGHHSGGGGSNTSGGSGSGAPTPATLFEYHVKDTLLDKCVKNLLDSLKSHNHGVGEFLYKFAGNDLDYNWNVISEDLGSKTVGSTDPPVLYDKEKNIITTRFNSSSFTNATDLSWVKTILHESAHAYFSRYYATEGVVNFVKTYPEMAEEWGDLQNWNDVHHEEFVRSVVNDIATILKEFGQMKGYDITDQYYYDLAWGGLTETSTFEKLNSEVQTRIKNTISIELKGENLHGDTKEQKGSKAGC